tara:strand:- start:15593 stop:17443 length:1851 start_codon:yes stop_codon:yes gene_type:complete
MSLTKVSFSMINGAYTNVKDFGATGDGSTNDTAAIQLAIDNLASSGGVLYFPPGTYKIARTVGTNDHWGLKVTGSNLTIIGEGASLARYNSDISTYALAYPLLFIGTPDSNVASATQNVKVTGITFVGNDVRHSVGGGSPNDFRCGVYMKNTKNTVVQDCVFTAIDSSAVYYQSPVSYDYTNNVYYNTTKNYNSRLVNCQFLATAHSTVDRALIHAIEASGIDYLSIENNYFEWCDDCFSAETTYDTASQTENDTYLPIAAGWSLGNVKRCGRGHNIIANTMVNSSEHCVYAASFDVVIADNNCRIENATICQGDIKNRAKNASITGNRVTARITCIGISEPALDVTVTGNVLTAISEGTGGVIGIQANELKSYIYNRYPYLTYIPMQNISITGNVINFPTAAAASPDNAVGVRFYAPDSSVTEFPNGMLLNTVIADNVFTNHAIGVYLIGALTNIKYINVVGNTFYGKGYAGAFGPSATLNTYAAVVSYYTSTEVMNAVDFNNNIVNTTTYLFATNTGGGTNVYGPNSVQGNRFDYIQNYKSSDLRSPAVDLTMFCNNGGSYFLDRTGWVGATSLNNGLGNATNTTNSYRKYRISYNGTNVLFYTDDSGTSITLG